MKETIHSTHNPKIQQVRELMQKARERRAAQRFIVEGVRLIEETLTSPRPPEIVFYAEERRTGRMDLLLQKLEAAGSELQPTAPTVLNSLSDTETTQGILAIAPIPAFEPPDQVTFAVIADRVSDPGNLGALLRTAAAAGAQAVVLSPETADPYAPKVVRAGMGAHFRLPLLQAENWEQVAGFCKAERGQNPLRVLCTAASAALPIWDTDLRNPLAVVVSNEAAGLSAEAAGLADLTVSIPMPGQVESLNAAVAAGIVLFEVVRQRRKTPIPKELHPASKIR